MGAKKKVLVVDIGGNNVKLLATGHKTPRKVPSGRRLTPRRLVAEVLPVVADWKYDVVSIGYPGVVRDNHPAIEPVNLGRGWKRFDFAKAFKRPVRVINDAAMQALGSYRGGKMLFLGLGTGLGSALIVDGQIVAMELGHLRRSKHHDYEDLLGKRGYKRLGRKKWRRKVRIVVKGFAAALLPDEIVIGGGQADRLKKLPPRSRLGDNALAFIGGFRLWDESPRARSLTRSPTAYKDRS